MRIRNLFIACLLLPSLTLSAQTDLTVEQKKKEINNIKKSNQYIYAEATAATEQEAKDIAEEVLYQEINKWVATQKKLRQSNEILINGRKELWSTVSLNRGNMFRSFMYVKKSNIQSGDNTEVITNEHPMTPEEDEAASKAATKKALNSTVTPINSTSTQQQAYPEVVMQIAACTEYADMAEKVKSYHDNGKIGSYARYAQLTKPEIYYLAIYNKAGKVVAILSPGEKRINVKTKQEDKITNYAGCGAIGFTVK